MLSQIIHYNFYQTLLRRSQERQEKVACGSFQVEQNKWDHHKFSLWLLQNCKTLDWNRKQCTSQLVKPWLTCLEATNTYTRFCSTISQVKKGLNLRYFIKILIFAKKEGKRNKTISSPTPLSSRAFVYFPKLNWVKTIGSFFRMTL